MLNEDSFSQAIELFINRLKKVGLQHQLKFILLAMRGPDNGCDACKTLGTAPIRMFILGELAYKQAGFWPNWFNSDLPTSDELLHLSDCDCGQNGHFIGHMITAVDALLLLIKKEKDVDL